MGSPPNEKDRDDDEDEVDVRLTVGFWMMETEVTQGLWKAVMGSDAVAGRWSSSSGVGDDLPVYEASHTEATAFAAKLTDALRDAGLLSGELELALPTEAQWEYAARAGSTSRFHWGDDESKLGDHAWFSGNDGGMHHSVGSKRPNDWGLRDTAGSVWEWTSSGYASEMTGGDDPRGAPGAATFVFRGGGIGFDPRGRPAPRGWYEPGSRNECLGFRLAAVRSGP